MRSPAIALLAGLFAVALACSESTAPLGQGDNVIDDTDGGPQQPTQGDDDSGGDDSPFAPTDSLYGSVPDGYDPYGWCSQCTCPANTFCFGGGTGVTTFNGDCHVEAGALGSGNLAPGCYPIPGGCGVEPSCECLIQAVSPLVSPCYPVCSITNNIVYCPHP